jgi:ParB family transcriptional regulator, chromosome partitioning protein
VARRKGLGRGLDALLAGSASAALDDASDSGELRQLPVDLLQRGRFQPRVRMDDASLQGLADSIRERGVLQPIVVRPVAGGRFEIIAGERRWRAAQAAGLNDVPALVRDVEDEAALAIALIENIQREDLNAIEEARALKRLIDEFGITHTRAAQAVGRSRAAVSNLLRLLDLSDDVRGLVEAGALEMGHARALLALPATRQSQVAAEVVARGLSTRDTEALVKRTLAGPPASRRPAGVDADVQRLERELKERLGARVELRQRRGGRGALVIHYTSLDELDGILRHIRPA